MELFFHGRALAILTIDIFRKIKTLYLVLKVASKGKVRTKIHSLITFSKVLFPFLAPFLSPEETKRTILRL